MTLSFGRAGYSNPTSDASPTLKARKRPATRALRPMSDFDIMVPTADAGAAGRIMVKAGWHSPYQDFLDSLG